jgi:signal transduction histidine kinase
MLRVQAGVNRLGPTDPVRAALERAVDRADGVLFEARDRVNALRGGRPVGASLGRQLQQAGDDLALDHAGRFFSVIPSDEPALAEALQEEVLRIGTEALRNAFQHGQPGEVRLTLQQTPRGLALEIVDDGRGMALGSGRDGRTRGHWGIPGMHERARAIGGRLTIVSAPGEGTRVRLQVRLRRSPLHALLRGRAASRLLHDPESRHDA